MWGIIGCVMSFAISLVSERVHGTFVRLQMAPLTRAQVLGGKALACFLAISILQIAIFTMGAVVFGVRPASLPAAGARVRVRVGRLCRLHDDDRESRARPSRRSPAPAGRC